jgi:predicted GNAT family acetyltransferase
VTITDLIPALKGRGRRRAVDEVERLRQNEIALLTNLHAAGDEIALLRNDLADAHKKQGEAEELVVKQLADIDDAVTVPSWVRDTSDPADQATGPIDVSPLWAARDAGLLGSVTDPGHTA